MKNKLIWFTLMLVAVAAITWTAGTWIGGCSSTVEAPPTSTTSTSNPSTSTSTITPGTSTTTFNFPTTTTTTSTTTSTPVSTQPNLPFTISTIETVGTDQNAILLDQNDFVHIFYLVNDYPNFHLRYTTNQSGSWETSTIINNIAGNFSAAIDSNGYFHIAYVPATIANLVYASNSSGAWKTEVIDSSSNPTGIISLAVDQTNGNKLHIAYNAGTLYNYVLKYATKDVGGWTITNVESSGGDNPIDCSIGARNGLAHLVYRVGGTAGPVKYASNEAGSWIGETIASNGIYPRLALDQNGGVYILYQAISANNPLNYANFSSGVWTTGTIDNNPNAIYAITVDHSNNVLVCFRYGSPPTSFKLARKAADNTIWVKSGIDYTDGAGTGCSIAADSSGKAHVSYYNYLTGILKYAHQ